MGKNKKKKDRKKSAAAPAETLEAEVERLRLDNEALRARLEKIAELASDLPGEPADDEDEEYDELKRDVDDQIASDRGSGKPEDVKPG